MRTRQKRANPRAAALAEAAASLALLIPLVVVMIFTIMEVSYAYFLKSSLAECARRAARDMSIAYGVAPLIVSSRATQDLMVYNNIRLTNVLNDSRQFDDAAFSVSTDPATVTITVHYLSNKYGLPTFPYPDPLNLGINFQISATSTYRLE